MALPGKMNRMPNGMCICVDKIDEGTFAGRLFHFYEEAPIEFSDILSLTDSMGRLMDSIGFPEATVKSRTFKGSQENSGGEKIDKANKIFAMKDLMEKRGGKGTFIVTVNSRNNATWQGDAYDVVHDRALTFASEIELFNIIKNNID